MGRKGPLLQEIKLESGKPSSDATQKTGLPPEGSVLSGREVRKDFWSQVGKHILRCRAAGEAQYKQNVRLGNEKPPLKDKASARTRGSWEAWGGFFSAIEEGKNMSACVPKRNGCGQKGRRWSGGGRIVFIGISESDINNAELGES